jgi:hypothetical protein
LGGGIGVDEKNKIEKNIYMIYHIHHIKMENVYRDWSGIKQRIIAETRCRPYAGVGIFRSNINAILRSVDNTPYYDDNLDDMDNPKYTLFGHNGDQSVDERRFNAPLLNPEKTQHIYLYRMIRKNLYIWYGKYEIVGRNTQPHQGRDGTMRNIIVLSLRKIVPRT